MLKAHTVFECENSCGHMIQKGDTVWPLDGKKMCRNCALAWTAMNHIGEASGS